MSVYPRKGIFLGALSVVSDQDFVPQLGLTAFTLQSNTSVSRPCYSEILVQFISRVVPLNFKTFPIQFILRFLQRKRSILPP